MNSNSNNNNNNNNDSKTPAEEVLSSNHLQSNYFKKTDQVPEISELQLAPNGKLKRKWIFSSPTFNYDVKVLDIATRDCINNILGFDDVNKQVVFPVSKSASGEYLAHFLLTQDDWPAWISLSRQNCNALSYFNEDEHAVWYFVCKQPGCSTKIEVTVSLAGQRLKSPYCELTVEFLNTTKGETCCCEHWEHHRTGTLTSVDKAKYGQDTSMKEWDKSKMENINTKQTIYCNSSGSLRNMKQAQNLRYKNNKYDLKDEYNVMDYDWMNELTQDAINDKKLKSNALLAENIKDVCWQEIGWYQQLDMVNMKIQIYSRESCDPLSLFKKAFPDGIFVDDMSHLVPLYFNQNLCHSIGFVKHPAGRLPLTVFELISGDWGGTTFKQQFSDWWIYANEHVKLDVPSFNVDWDRKLQNRICEVVNGYNMRKYQEICYNIPIGKAKSHEINHKIFGCHGHGSGSISRHSNGQPVSKQLGLNYWRYIRNVDKYEVWKRSTAYFKWLCESDWIDLNLVLQIQLFDPIERMNLKKLDKYDQEIHEIRNIVMNELQNLNITDEQMKDIDFWTNDLEKRIEQIILNSGCDNDNTESNTTLLSDVTHTLFPQFSNSDKPDEITEYHSDDHFRIHLYGNELQAFIPFLQVEIPYKVDGDKIKFEIEDEKLDEYIWFAFVQFFGCYSAIIHQNKQQVTTGVGERGNRHRRTFVKNKGLGATLPMYIRSVIEYIKQQWVMLPTDCQAEHTIKPPKKYLRLTGKMPYRRKKGAAKQTHQEELFQVTWDGTISHIKKTLSINYILTNPVLIKSILHSDTKKIMPWAKTTFGTNVSKLNNGRKWLPQNSNKAGLILQVFEDWCKQANLIKNNADMQNFIECKKNTGSKKRTIEQSQNEPPHKRQRTN